MSVGQGHQFEQQESVDQIAFEIVRQRELHGEDSPFDRFVREYVGELGTPAPSIGHLAVCNETEYDYPQMSQCSPEGMLMHVRIARDVPIDDEHLDRYYVVSSDIVSGVIRRWRVARREIREGEAYAANTPFWERLHLVAQGAVSEREYNVLPLRADIEPEQPYIDIKPEIITPVFPGMDDTPWFPIRAIQRQLSYPVGHDGPAQIQRRSRVPEFAESA